MEKVLKIGIIGCGAIGKDHCRRIIETVPGATVVAVSDYVAAAADDTAAKYGIKSYGNDCDGMIKDPEVEAVVITSIDPTHHDYVMKTLAEEKWCFCEKPLSQNAADCEDIIKRELEIGKRLAVVPSWQEYDTDRVKLVLDPGLAFGTGGHETTSLCMEALDERVTGGERVLDIGTGSGILAIAALKLGAAVAEGVDIDPVAVRTAGENAALNGVQDKLTVLVGDLSDKASGKYDIITANIVANAILSLAPAVPGLMAEGATFIASGIIDSRKDEVIAGLEKAGLAVVEVKEKRGWECIVCKKA